MKNLHFPHFASLQKVFAEAFSYKIILGLLVFFLGNLAAEAQVKNDFDVRYEADIRGELTFIGNNIVNRESNGGTRREWQFINGRWRLVTITLPVADANDPYNDTGDTSEYNDRWDMQYIDVDSDPTTFSSSSADLMIPDPSCSLVRYAGLYWSAVYVNNDRSNIDQVRFRVPGGTYQNITADELLFDGDGDVDFGFYSLMRPMRMSPVWCPPFRTPMGNIPWPISWPVMVARSPAVFPVDGPWSSFMKTRTFPEVSS